MFPIRFALLAAAVAGLLVLSGCADLPASPTAPQPTAATVQPTEPGVPSESEVPGDPGDTTEPGQPTPSAAEPTPAGGPSPSDTGVPPEQPFTVRPGAIDGVRVNASVFPVRRAGQTAVVNVLLASANPEERFSLQMELSDGNPEVGSRENGSVDGLRLVDATNKKAYLPATTGDGVCACTPADDRMWTKDSAIWVSVIFAAPPADLTTINVQIPQFGTVTDVPLA